MSRFLHLLASLSRALPPIRGKSPLGAELTRLLCDFNNKADYLVTFTMKDGSIMRVDLRSRTEIWSYWTGFYDPLIIRRLKTCLKPDAIVLDIGANVGFYSVALGRTLKNLNGTLWAFEPVASNYRRIQEVVELNQLDTVVRPQNIALGDEEGEIQLWMEDTDGASTGNAVILQTDGASNAEKEKHKSNCTARITRLDAFAEEQNLQTCHLIKIDVEGAELMFLRGGQAFLQRSRPIIYGEFNVHWMKQFGHSFLDVFDLVQPWNYRFYQQVENSAFRLITTPKAELQDILMLPIETPADILSRLGCYE